MKKTNVRFTKKPFTISEFAEKYGLTYEWARKTILAAVQSGEVKETGIRKSTTGRGPKTFAAA